ncbi:MAG: hypothetical protein PHO83_06305 [Geobacteraceae bacterium]|nr:hypothetical protein [Geobacteraceae bacterium]
MGIFDKIANSVFNATNKVDIYYSNLAQNVFDHIIFREITESFESAGYDKNINITQLLIFCAALNLATYRVYNRKCLDNVRSKNILTAINILSINNVFEKVRNNFNSRGEAADYYQYRVEEYCCCFDSGNLPLLIMMFLENVLIDKSDAFSETDLRNNLLNSIEQITNKCIHYYTFGKFV